MIIKTIPILKINPAAYNPRKDLQPADPEYKKLKKSLTEFDCVEPLVWNETTGNLVGGHQRLKILKEMGRKEVEVSVVKLDDAKEKVLNLALNKIGGEWDYPKLKDILEELNTGAFDIEITGFDDKEIEELMTQFHVPDEGLTDDDAIPEEVDTLCKTGDLWQLGSHRLLCGDSTKKEDVARLMGGEKADMVFTDPPYNVGFNYNSYMDKKAEPEWMAFCATWYEMAKRFSDYIAFTPGQGNVWCFYQLDKSLRQLTWHKKFSLSNGYISHAVVVEPILCFGKPRERYDTDYFEFQTDREKDLLKKFPCPKPVSLVCALIDKGTKTGDKVFDLFGGSGSTLIACEKLSRRCFMMEIDEHYCDVIIKRWEDFTGKKAVKLNGYGGTTKN